MIKVLPFSVLRTPLLPYNGLANLQFTDLKHIFSNKAVQEAIFLASPSLYTTMQEWLEGKMKDAKKIEKLEISLAKYLLRMSYRCTPFGLFAGITHIEKCNIDFSLCNVDEKQPEAQTKVYATFKQAKIYDTLRHTRLDMDYLCALSYNLTKNAEIRETLRYFPNNTIYEIGENLRYAEYRIYKRSRNHFLVSIDNSIYVQKILEVAASGAVPQQLAESIVDEEITFNDAIDFVYEMIDNQVLSSELEPHITGEEYFDRLLLKSLPNLAVLNEINQTLRQIDKQPLGSAVSQYYEIAEKLKSLGTDFELGQLFQVDTKQNVSVELPQVVLDDLSSTIELLLATAQYKEHPNLKKFKELFRERYETQEMPLLQVLDNETGMGYPPQESHQADNSPLLNGIGIGFMGQNQVNSYEWTSFQQFLVDKYINTIANKEKTIQINKAEIQRLALNRQSYSPATSLKCFASILATKDIEQDETKYQIYLKGVSGPSAATLLGRFCHLDNNLAENIKQALVEEANSNPDAIFAEIVHINQGRIGNISMRPQLRNYEIPILVQASTDTESTILLKDLMVSVKNNRIVLRSKTLNKEVIPRLSSAHNFGANALPFYHFLCEMQFQNCITGYHWNWGVLANRDTLPRVIYEDKVILSKAKWVLKASEITPIANAKIEEQLPKLKELIAKRELPRFVILVEGDNELPIDTENELCLAVLLDFVKPNRQIILEENLFTTNNLIATNEKGGFTNEFVFPLQYVPEEQESLSKTKQTLSSIENLTSSEVTRNFAVGSSWLYLKIYCGVKTADKILTEVIRPIAEKYLDSNEIEKWFFIRYTDPQHHIRLRFYKENGNFGDILKELHQLLQPYLHTNLISTIQSDIYKREIERYGTVNIENSETLFCYDSIAIVNILSQLANDDSGDVLRWQLALLGTDKLLTDFGLDLPAKKEFMTILQTGFHAEFGIRNKDAKKMLSDKFRTERKVITELLTKEFTESDAIFPIIKIFEQRSQDLKPIIATILEQQKNQQLDVEFNDLLGSYIHMFINRFLRSKQRQHELVIYDFLVQFYTSELARKK